MTGNLIAMGGYVYMMSSRNNVAVYTGVTANLYLRVAQHRRKIAPDSFTTWYNCVKLVYYQWFDSIEAAIREEKRIKGGSRRKKEMLIESMNPEWRDLYDDFIALTER